jgi:NTE family protein
VDNASYFEQLVGSLSRIAGHSYYPGKEEAVERCLEEIEEIRLSGQISAEQSATLRELLLGEESSGLMEGDLRQPPPWGEAAMPSRVAIACQGDGSHAAFAAGVLQGLLEQDGDSNQIAALSGIAYGSICALLAWDGLLRGDPQRAVDQLRGFWHDYAATSLFDVFLNGSAQMAFQLRSMVAFPGLNPDDAGSWNRELLRRILEGRVDFAEARSMAGDEDVPGLVVGAVDGSGETRAFHGPQIDADQIIASATLPGTLAAVAREGRIRGDGLLLHNPPIRELTDFGPEELWVIQVIKSTRKGSCRTAGDPADHHEWTGRLLLEQELRFLETINGLLGRGLLIGGGYRQIEVHRIVMEHDLDPASKLDRSPSFLGHLMAHGRERAQQFLETRRCRLTRPSPTRSIR